MGRQRHVIEEDVTCGDHVGWKSGHQKIAKLIGLRPLVDRSNKVGDQLRLAVHVVSRRYHGRLDSRVFHQNMLDFLKLDPTATDFYLMVDAA
jgi:hypothetical protein